MLTGQVAVVTGAAGRLGPFWAKALRDAGAPVVVVDRTPSLGVVTCDITDPEAVAALEQKIRKLVGRVSILVNNAGIDSRPGSGDYPAMASDMVRVNILGTDLMTRVFGESMKAHGGGGTIINIASLYGLVSPDLRYYDHRPDQWVKDPIYGATKAAVISLTKYYAAAYAKHGIRVNALAPGGVVAPGDGLTAQDPAFVEKYTSRIPMGRMCQPSDLGGALVFLASPASSFVTGQCLALDGGYLCW